MRMLMEELSPDVGMSEESADIIHLRLMSQRLKDKEFDQVNTEVVGKILRALANDKGESQGKSLKIAGRKGAEQQMVYVKFPWKTIKKRMQLRHNCSRLCLNAIISALPNPVQQGQARVLGIIRRQKTDGENYDGNLEKMASGELPIVEILHEKRLYANT